MPRREELDLSGHSNSQSSGYREELLSPCEGLGSVQDDAASGFDHADTDLEKPESQSVDLGPLETRTSGGVADLLEEGVGGGHEQISELVGEKARATRSVELEQLVIGSVG